MKLSRSHRKFIHRTRARLLRKIRRHNTRLFEAGLARLQDDYTPWDDEFLRLCKVIYADRVARSGEGELPF